jgi:hypothetical protein
MSMLLLAADHTVLAQNVLYRNVQGDMDQLIDASGLDFAQEPTVVLNVG